MSADENSYEPYELQQLVSSDEEIGQNIDEIFSSEFTTIPKDSAKSTPRSKNYFKRKINENVYDHNSSIQNKYSSLETNAIDNSSVNSSKQLHNNTHSISTNSSIPSQLIHGQSSNIASKTADSKPLRPPQPNIAKLQNKKVLSLEQSSQHHSFLSDVMDVRQMEHSLLHLLDDFHSGKLRAFGKNCSMEQMTEIHQQQEYLARLHFELGAQQELFVPLSDDGLKQGSDNMKSLMDNLERLSLSIEKLHNFNISTDT